MDGFDSSWNGLRINAQGKRMSGRVVKQYEREGRKEYQYETVNMTAMVRSSCCGEVVHCSSLLLK